MVQANKVVNKIGTPVNAIHEYVVMVPMDDGTHIELSGTRHKSRFSAFLEKEHALDDPKYVGYTFYIKEEIK